MANQLNLFISQVKDEYVKENFKKIQAVINSETLFNGFRFFELTFSQAESNVKIPHNLGFLPKDILLTSKTGSGAITFNQDLTSSTELDISVTGACVVRFIAGTFS